MDQGGRVIAAKGVAAATAIGGSALGRRADLLRRDREALCPAMSRLAAPLATGGRGRRLPFEADGVGRRWLGGVGGVELEPGLEVTEALLQLGDPSPEGVDQVRDGGLGFRWDGIPEWCRDGRLRAHANKTTESPYKMFGP